MRETVGRVALRFAEVPMVEQELVAGCVSCAKKDRGAKTIAHEVGMARNTVCRDCVAATALKCSFVEGSVLVSRYN